METEYAAHQNWDRSQQIEVLSRELFLEKWNGKIGDNNKLTGDVKATDFYWMATGELIELKAEYTNISSGNIAVERYSRVVAQKYPLADIKTDGGPWQAIAKGAKYFVHLFINLAERRILEERWTYPQWAMDLCEPTPGYRPYSIVPTIKPNIGGQTRLYIVPKVCYDRILIEPPN